MPTTDHKACRAEPLSWLYLDLPQTEYGQALEMQHRLVAARKLGRLDRDIVLFLEHPPVYTLGKRGGKENLKISEAFLERSGIQIVPIERGGNITYHGPGQLVVYLIVHLSPARLSVDDFVYGIEEVMLRSVQHWHVRAERNRLNRGVWVGNRKLGSIGIAIRRGVSFHGLALNVNTDLTPFTWINPCGLNGVGMTSMQNECGHPIAMDEMRGQMRIHFEHVFKRSLEAIGLEDLERMLDNGSEI